MSRPQPGFAAVDPPEGWAPTRGRFRPERLEAPLDSLPGVGPTLKKRLAKLGLEHVGDLLDHRPRRYEQPAPERRIADLFGEEEVLIEGEVLRTSLRRGRGRLQILTAQVSDGSIFEVVQSFSPSIFQVPVIWPSKAVNLPSGV